MAGIGQLLFRQTHLVRSQHLALRFKQTLRTMLEAFEILTTSGVVLWSKSYAPVGPHIVNSLINDVFIEERVRLQNPAASGASPIFKKEKYTLKWKRVKDLNLIFVVRLPLPCYAAPTLVYESTLTCDIGRLPVFTSSGLDR